jgi:hypothetical protein
VDNEILQMLVESMVGHSEQALGRTKHQAADEDTLTQGENKVLWCGQQTNKDQPMATNRHLPRALP